jgi:hypothetical protein
MADKRVEKSPSGSPIYRYEQRTKPFEPAFAGPDIKKIEQHFHKHIGKIEMVFHELVSDLVHVDVFWVKPTPQRNFHTLITSGMSDHPMKTPPQAEQCKYAELLICLPPQWPLSDEAMKDENNYWPIRALKMLARLPHAYDTWLWYAHTIPNGDPPKPFARNTNLSGIIIELPILAPKDFFKLEITPEKTIYFFSILPIYTEEMNFKLHKGADALFERFDQQGINELLDVQRPNVCKKSPWPFGR